MAADRSFTYNANISHKKKRKTAATHQTEMMQIKLSPRMKNHALQMVVTISENHRQESKLEP